MARQIISAIDIGTSTVKVIIAEGLMERGHRVPQIIGTGIAESRGVSRGYITDPEETAKSIEHAVRQAEKMCGIKVKRAYVSLGGVGLSSNVTEGSISISRADMEITERDIATVLESAEAALPKKASTNRSIINTVPIEYKVDEQISLGQVVGLKADKLEVKALFITCLEHHLSNLIDAVESAGLEVADVVAAPVAASFVTLSKKQKKVGSVLVDIGAETTSMVVYENDSLISLAVFDTGGNDITNDIALGLKISLDDAENAKIDSGRGVLYSQKKLNDITSSRLKSIFSRIHTQLKSIDRDALLPGGSIIIGGSADLSGLKGVAENVLKLPAEIGEVYFGSSSLLDPKARSESKIKDRTWAIACGLSIVGFNADGTGGSLGASGSHILREGWRRSLRSIKHWISQFLP